KLTEPRPEPEPCPGFHFPSLPSKTSASPLTGGVVATSTSIWVLIEPSAETLAVLADTEGVAATSPSKVEASFTSEPSNSSLSEALTFRILFALLAAFRHPMPSLLASLKIPAVERLADADLM